MKARDRLAKAFQAVKRETPGSLQVVTFTFHFLGALDELTKKDNVKAIEIADAAERAAKWAEKFGGSR